MMNLESGYPGFILRLYAFQGSIWHGSCTRFRERIGPKAPRKRRSYHETYISADDLRAGDPCGERPCPAADLRLAGPASGGEPRRLPGGGWFALLHACFVLGRVLPAWLLVRILWTRFPACGLHAAGRGTRLRGHAVLPL